jgi:hypothetical protein
MERVSGVIMIRYRSILRAFLILPLCVLLLLLTALIGAVELWVEPFAHWCEEQVIDQRR